MHTKESMCSTSWKTKLGTAGNGGPLRDLQKNISFADKRIISNFYRKGDVIMYEKTRDSHEWRSVKTRDSHLFFC
jgi:hypothetical protein